MSSVATGPSGRCGNRVWSRGIQCRGRHNARALRRPDRVHQGFTGSPIRQAAIRLATTVLVMFPRATQLNPGHCRRGLKVIRDAGAGVSVVPPKSTGSSILGGPYGAAGRAPAAAPPPETRFPAPQGFQPPSTPQTRETLSIVPPRQDAKPPGAGGVFGGQGFKEIMSNKFMSKFVASGSTGRSCLFSLPLSL